MKDGRVLDRRSLAFTVMVKDGDKVFNLYIPTPARDRVDSISPIMGHLFSLRQSTNLSPMVIARDYEYYVHEGCQISAKRLASSESEIMPLAEEMFGKFRNFLESSLMLSYAFDEDGKKVDIIKTLSQEAINEALGLYVFFYSVYRYASAILSEKDTRGFLTSLSPMEYQKYLGTQLSDAGNTPENQTMQS